MSSGEDADDVGARLDSADWALQRVGNPYVIGGRLVDGGAARDIEWNDWDRGRPEHGRRAGR